MNVGQLQALSIGCHGYFYSPSFVASNSNTIVVEGLNVLLDNSQELFGEVESYSLDAVLKSTEKITATIVTTSLLNGIIETKPQELFGILTEEN